MQAKSKRNELVKSGAYDGRYREKVAVSKKKPPRKTLKVKTQQQMIKDLEYEDDIDIGPFSHWLED